jgi:hypothetical protein
MFVFWVVTPCGLVSRYERFGETYCLQLQGWSQPYVPMVFGYKFIWLNNPENQHRHLHRRENSNLIYHGIWLVGLMKTTTDFSQDSRWAGIWTWGLRSSGGTSGQWILMAKIPSMMCLNIHISMSRIKSWRLVRSFASSCNGATALQVKSKAVPLHAMEAHEGRGGIAPTHT